MLCYLRTSQSAVYISIRKIEEGRDLEKYYMTKSNPSMFLGELKITSSILQKQMVPEQFITCPLTLCNMTCSNYLAI